MSRLIDSSILIAALLPGEDYHRESLNQIELPDTCLHVHAVNEAFSILTGGRLGFRIEADTAAKLIRDRISARLKMIVLEGEEILDSLAEARRRGVRGGAIYDFMHLIAARKAGVQEIVTLNFNDFTALVREGDPEVKLPV